MARPARIALVDCNNFYVSCERLFRPDLWRQPVAVLSNNDGCIVARSQEVKDLGIKMGTPLHEVEALLKQHGVHLFSSNYALYADISARVMTVLYEFTPDIEIYSIDESFLDLSTICCDDIVAYGFRVKQRVARDIGIPVCVGIGPTKTLAKLANFAAKKWKKTGGVVDLSDPDRRRKLMSRVPVDEVWGIGSRLSRRLAQAGIHTVGDLCRQSPDKMHAQFNVVVARTVLELQGVACLDLEEVTPPRQQIVCSRSFKYRLSEWSDLYQALAEFTSRAAEKLRAQHSLAGSVSVSIRTNPFNPKEPQYQRTASLVLPSATQDTRYLLAVARRLLEQIFRPGYRYQKCAVQLGHIKPQSSPGQLDLFDITEILQQDKAQQVMQVMDRINQRYPHALHSAALGLGVKRRYQPQRLSGRYTTRWDELALARCK